VTGAFSYSGRRVAERLLSRGDDVRTLTFHPERAAASPRPLEAYRYDFESPDRMLPAFQGAHTLINTYWVRFARGGLDHERAVQNTRHLFEVALRAGVGRIVHVSITQPDLNSPLPYFRGRRTWSGTSARSPSPRHRPAGGAVRRRGHSHQQHRLRAPPLPVFACLAPARTGSSPST